MKRKLISAWSLMFFSAFNSQISTAHAQTTTFTYQGRLSGPSVDSGSYDFTFALFEAASGPAQIGSTITNSATALTNGLFTVALDFGNRFPGASRWLEIAVRTNGGGAFATLAPRQAITPTPYAITASNLSGTLPAAQLSGTIASANLAGPYTNALALSNAANSFSGDGANLTNLNALAVANAPWATTNQLSSKIAMSNGGGTNTFLLSPTLSNAVTPVRYGYATVTNFNFNGDTNGMALLLNNTTNDSGIAFGTNGRGGKIFNSASHGGNVNNPSTYEMAFIAPGKMAFVPLVGNIQIGGFEIGNPSFEMYTIHSKNGAGRYDDTPNVMAYSVPFLLHASLNSNGVPMSRFPGLVGHGVSTNGTTELMLFNNCPATPPSFTDMATTRGIGMYYGGPNDYRGTDLRGGLIQEKSSYNSATNCPLNFANSKAAVIEATSTAITFYTTNTTPGSTNYEDRVFFIRSGFVAPTITFPTGWTWLTNGSDVTPPTTIPLGLLMRLQLECIGAGTTNIVASARFGTDTSFSIDADAALFFTRAGITNPTAKSSVNTLVKDLKGADLWNNFTNGFLYPFAGTGSTNNAKNLMGTAYTITWNGTLGHTNGVTSDGSTGYGDTGCAPNAVPGGFHATNQFFYVNYATNNTPIASYFAGTFNNYAHQLIYTLNPPNQKALGNLGGSVNTAGIIIGNGVSDGNFALNRTNSAGHTGYTVTTADPVTSTSTGLDDGNIHICARNVSSGSGVASGFYKGTIKAAAFGRGMTDAQIATFFSIMNTYQTAMGRAGMTQ